MASKPTPSADQLGALLGPRLASVIVDALADYSHKTTHHKAQVITSGLEGLLDLVGAELHPYLAPIIREAAQHPEMPEHVAGLLSFAADHPGEGASLLRFAIGASGVGSGLGTVLSAVMAPAVQYILRGYRTGLPDPGSLAQAVARKYLPEAEGAQAAASQNLDRKWFDMLSQLSVTELDVSSLITMLNRGVIDRSAFENFVQRAGYTDDAASLLGEIREQVLSPADAADMVVRGIIDKAEGERIASLSGVPAVDFDRLVLDTGEPLALEQLLLLYRRGQIDQATLEHGIRQSRVRNEWIADAVNLRYAPPSGADAIKAAVQNQLSIDEAKRKLGEAGTDPKEFEWLFNTAGRPPGIQELVGLWRKGYVTQSVVEQAIRESDVKTKYLPAILKTFENLPPPRTVSALLRAGAIDDAEAADLLAREGVPAKLAAAEVKAAHHTRTAAARHLAQGTIVKLYHERAITHAEALDMLKGIGWNDSDSGFILAAEDLHREASALDHAITHIRSLYTGYHIDRGAAVAAIGELGVAPDQVGHLFSLWDLERTANQKQIPHGTITTALKYEIIDQPTAQTLLEAQGFSPFNAWVLISAALKGPQGAPPGGA